MPALLVRLAVYGHGGRIELTQGEVVRELTFTRGRLTAAASTEPHETIEDLLEQVLGGGRHLVEARAEAHNRGVPLLEILRDRGTIEPAAFEAAARAHARHVVLGCVADGDATAWLERYPPETTPSGGDLNAFAAVWEAIARRYPEPELDAFARRLAGHLRPVDAALAFLRDNGAEPSVVRLAATARAAGDVDWPRLGALALCGLVAAGSERVVAPTPLPPPERGVPAAGRAPPPSPPRPAPPRRDHASGARRHIAVITVSLALGAGAGAAAYHVLAPILPAGGAPEDAPVSHAAAAGATVESPASSAVAATSPAPARPPEAAEPAPRPGAPLAADLTPVPEAPAARAAVSTTEVGNLTDFGPSPQRPLPDPQGAAPAGATAPAPSPPAARGSSSPPEKTAEAGDNPAPRLSATTLLNDAGLLLQNRNARDALPLLLRAQELDPRQPSVHRSLGIAYTLLGDRTAAATAYRRYLALRPDAPDRADVTRWLEVLESRP